ncbi:hypothetical protein PVAND_007576 [Polypedilum vanderplanki]|uniref:Uncharacterized protein n=1 Tax=Polypedilum vanderplanki TaxID=319348 RepID=A0A9J6C7L7_POLVA|nr:hypothetical protein PVAND_007576 [Polypedilum vanderplanki]
MNSIFFIPTILLAILVISQVNATLDWTNLDLMNFQYFKEKPTTTVKPIFFRSHGHLYSIRRIPDSPNKFQQTVSKTKAVLKYLKGVAFGTEEEKIKISHEFDPTSAEKLSKSFQEKHGKYGEKLVEFLGSGPSRENLIRAGAI